MQGANNIPKRHLPLHPILISAAESITFGKNGSKIIALLIQTNPQSAACTCFSIEVIVPGRLFISVIWLAGISDGLVGMEISKGGTDKNDKENKSIAVEKFVVGEPHGWGRDTENYLLLGMHPWIILDSTPHNFLSL